MQNELGKNSKEFAISHFSLTKLIVEEKNLIDSIQ